MIEAHERRAEAQLREVNLRIDHRVSQDTYAVDRRGIDARAERLEAETKALGAEMDARFDRLDQRQAQSRNLAIGGLILPVVATLVAAWLLSQWIGSAQP